MENTIKKEDIDSFQYLSTEERFLYEVNRINTLMADSINGRLKAEYVSCNVEEKEVTLRYPLLEWEVNGIGSLHGGIIAAMFDLTMFTSIFPYAGRSIPPTASMTINYLKPVPMEGYVYIKARATSAGRSLATSYAEAYLPLPEGNKILATAVGTFAVPQKH